MNDRGHVWKMDKWGKEPDDFAFESGNYDTDDGYPHFGRKCLVCGYYLCVAHNEEPEHDCPHPTTGEACEK